MLSPEIMATVARHVAVLSAASVTVNFLERVVVGTPVTLKAVVGSGFTVYGGVPPVGTATGPGIVAIFTSSSAAVTISGDLHVKVSAVS